MTTKKIKGQNSAVSKSPDHPVLQKMDRWVAVLKDIEKNGEHYTKDEIINLAKYALHGTFDGYISP